ncbi:MAG: hypothetical protein ACLP5V_01450 [Candidatus Bathyarchaeia archaeon]
MSNTVAIECGRCGRIVYTPPSIGYDRFALRQAVDRHELEWHANGAEKSSVGG